MKTILVDAVDTFVIKDEGIFKEMYDLLETFDNPKIILTSANDEQLKQFGLDDMPYEVFTLKHNPEKTDPKYYETMLKHFNLNKDDVIHFEHNEDAVKSAQSVGIKTYYYNPDKKDLIGLKEFLIEGLYTLAIRHDLPNFPDEIIEEWLKPLAIKGGWQPVGIIWNQVMLHEPLSFWKKTKWGKQQINLKDIQLVENSANIIESMRRAYLLGEDNSYAELFKGEKKLERFKKLCGNLKNKGAFAKPIALLQRGDKFEIADGHNRFLAWTYVDLYSDSQAEANQWAWVASI